MKILLPLQVLLGLASCQLDVYQRSPEGYRVVKEDPNEGRSEIYTSMRDLEWFFEQEQSYIKDLKIILDKKLVSSKAVQHLGTYINSYDEILGAQLEDKRFLLNPLNVYNLIRHVAVGWPVVEGVLKEEKEHREEIDAKLPKRVKRILGRRDEEHVPGQTDLDGAATAMVRLHDFYRFNVSRLVNEGVIDAPGIAPTEGAYITVWDVFKMAVKGVSKYIMGSGIEFMQEALVHAKTVEMSAPPFIPAIQLETLTGLIKTSKTIHDQKLDSHGPRSHYHSLNLVPFDKRLAKKKKFQKYKQPLEVKLNDYKIVETRHEIEQFVSLCRGDNLRPENVTKNLQCKYMSKNNVVYGPRKVEVLSLQPYIVMVHDFITPTEVKVIVDRASPNLKRSKTAQVEEDQQQSKLKAETRISEQTWLTEWEVPEMDRLTTRIQDFFDLNAYSTRDAELYQVANYGLSGQYTTHFDVTMIDKKSLSAREVFNIKNGDRIASVSYNNCSFIGCNATANQIGAVFWYY